MPSTITQSASSPYQRVDPLLVSDENRYAYTALNCESPISRLVYLYGPSGVGKTHLVRHCLKEALQNRDDLEYLETSPDDIIDKLSPEKRKTPTSDSNIGADRCCQLLVVHDVHQLQSRFYAQSCLISAIDTTLQYGGCVAVTSLKPPGELRQVHPKLISRFHGGICAAVGMPSADSRATLIQHFAQQLQLPLRKQVVQFLAAELPISPGELRGAVTQLDLASRSSKRTISVEDARRFIQTDWKPKRSTLTQIARQVARHFDVSVTELRSHKRLRGMVLPRQCAMFLSRELTGLNYQKIASFFGREHHSTVVHACDRFRQKLAGDPQLGHQIRQICQALRAPIPEDL